jgi:alkaline phosphatase
MADRQRTPLNYPDRAIPAPALILVFFLLVLYRVYDPGTGTTAGAKNVILFIGDGMGAEQVRAAGMYAHGSSGTLSFEAFPHRGLVKTHDAYFKVTDSAAASTAMATGVKVASGVISVARPGDISPLETLLERFQTMGKSTGLVTTTIITHATPAAFGAHRQNRSDYTGIAADYLNVSQPQVLFGGARYLTREAAERAGYIIVTDREGLFALDTEAAKMVSGQFGTDHMPFEAITGGNMTELSKDPIVGRWVIIPTERRRRPQLDGLGTLPHLSEMTRVALDIPDGLFLVVEGGRIDHAGHANDIERNVRETAEFSRAVGVGLEWAEKHPDTLILVTADHETGGLQVLGNNGIGRAPDVTWSTFGHTGVDVPIYGWGIGSAQVSGKMDNSRIYGIILRAAGSGGLPVKEPVRATGR